MLPGFRFLFAAILLSVSILVFGLGAAALLRATHEQYVSNPSWRNGPQEQMFAQAPEPAQPVLAALRVEPAAAEPEPSVRDRIPTIALPAEAVEQVAAVTTEIDVQPQVAAAPAEASAVEPTRTETTTEAAVPAPTDTLTPADTTAAIPAETTVASSALDVAAARVAALNDPATTAWKDAPAKPKVTGSKADGTTESKAAKPRAHRVKKRRRIVRRPPPPVQQLDPFGQQQPTFATTTTMTRTRQ